jgi:hypothetical protein
MSIVAHPATVLFPMMGEAELRDLADDIAAHGLQHPIVMHEGMVLDGRNRMRACEMVDRPVDLIQWEPNGASPVEWVISTNLHRRHLTTSQRGAIAVEALPMLEAERQEHSLANLRRGSDLPMRSFDPIGKTGEGRSTSIVAAQLGVSPATVKRAKQLHEQAPEIFEKVKAGEVTVTAGLTQAQLAPARPRSTEPRSNGRHPMPAPKRQAPVWTRHFTRWCRGVLPEDKRYLLAMSAELHTALAHLGLTCQEERI